MKNENQSSEQIYRTLALIWFALFMSQFMFLVVIYFAKSDVYKFDLTKPVWGDNAPLVLIFALLAVSNLILSFILSRKFINKAIEEQNVGFIQTAMIIGCALCESISLLGLVLAFAFSYQYFLIWFAIGILGILFHFPRRHNIHLATYKKSQEF